MARTGVMSPMGAETVLAFAALCAGGDPGASRHAGAQECRAADVRFRRHDRARGRDVNAELSDGLCK